MKPLTTAIIGALVVAVGLHALRIDSHNAGGAIAAVDRTVDMPWKIMSIGTRDWAYRS
jgi:hypothetical protein